jgi:hypothetical protein
MPGEDPISARVRTARARRIRGALTLALALGAARARAAAPAEEAPIALPPFLVEEPAKGPPWRFAEAMGYEILSRCDDATTRRVVEAHHRLHVLLAEILPPSLQLRTSLPRSLILYDEELNPAASREVIAQMLRSAGPEPEADFSAGFGGRGVRIAPPPSRISFLPNLRLWDRDGMAVFMIVRRGDFDADRLSLTPDYIGFLVKNRVPALPPWFVQGFLALYAETKYRGSDLEVAPLVWVSEAHTDAVKKNPATAPPVLPLGDFLQNRIAATTPEAAVEPRAAWQAQAALWVRWGLDPRGGARRAAFFRFVERCAVQSPGEPLFQECFGLDYAAAQAELAAYLPVAVRRALVIKPDRPARLPPLALRNASDGEIARIKGDWERLEVPYVKAISAGLAPKYLAQARRTLHRAYDRDVRDPGLLAVMGLCEADAGNDTAAREFLEAAARAGPIRPRAGYELARLRFADFRAQPEGEDGRLAVAQMVAVLQPLFAARAELPPLPEVYELIAEAWAHGSATPTRGHLAVLDEGVRLFPRRSPLVLRTAELNLRHGFRDTAAAYADLAGLIVHDESGRQRLAALRAELPE